MTEKVYFRLTVMFFGVWHDLTKFLGVPGEADCSGRGCQRVDNPPADLRRRVHRQQPDVRRLSQGGSQGYLECQCKFFCPGLCLYKPSYCPRQDR